MSSWSEEKHQRMGEEEARHNSGGYDFGGYIPGEEYFPAPKKRGKQIVASAVALLTIASLVLMMVL
ncbi:hypothetical protein VR010_09335 [Actinomycetaceae bacterium L2_0104]